MTASGAGRAHPLFAHLPLSGQVPTSQGPEPVPYHVYTGRAVFVGGTADLPAVTDLLAGEDVTVLRTADGGACMGVWICAFDDASLGPHHELQLSFFLADRSDAVPDRPLAILEALVARPDVRMLCHGLWNDTPRVVAYNREVLSLDAHLSSSTIAFGADGGVSFDVRTADGGALVSGALAPAGRTSMRVGREMVGGVGLGRLWRFSRQPWTTLRVVNTRRDGVPENLEAVTCTASDSRIRYLDATRDVLELGAPRYADLGFRPRFVQYMDDFTFVYQVPASGSAAPR